MDFADLASRAPHHDPLFCTRVPCGKCRPHDKAQPPKPVDHKPAKHQDRTVSPFTPLPPLLRLHAPHVTSDELSKTMLALAQLIHTHGNERWLRLLAWEDRTLPHGISLIRDEPGTDDDEGDDSTPRVSLSLLEEQYRAMEATASRSAQRARDAANKLPPLLHGLPHTERQVRTLVWRLHDLLTDAEARRNKTGPDQGCRSCARNGGHYEPVHEGRYASACRFCGEWKAGHGDWPPLAVVRWRHQNPGKRLPLRIVEAAK